MGHAGRLGGSVAVVERDDTDRLVVRWRDARFDLTETVVRHRDDNGQITFSMDSPRRPRATITYRRRYPTRADRRWDAIDFTADEPWSWEDRDFGLLIFHVATGTGPVKYRHLLDPRSPTASMERSLVVDDSALRHRLPDVRPQHVVFDELLEARVKFEVAGRWAPAAVLVLDSGRDLAVLPLGYRHEVDRFRAEALPRLRQLPGWDGNAEDAVDDACEYALRTAVGPGPGEPLGSRAERAVWAHG